MRILISNDDGYLAPGISALADALLGLLQDEVSSLEGALFGAGSDMPPALR